MGKAEHIFIEGVDASAQADLANRRYLAMSELVEATRRSVDGTIPPMLVIADTAASLSRAEAVFLVFPDPTYAHNVSYPNVVDPLFQFDSGGWQRWESLRRDSVVMRDGSTRPCDIVPIRSSGEIVGFVGFIHSELSHTPDFDWLASVVAASAAEVWDRARMQEALISDAAQRAESRSAHLVQARMMPRRPPSLPGAALTGRWVPSKAVGGDFYDWKATPTGSLAISAGDVAGKGTPAALVMAMAQTVGRCLRLDGTTDPLAIHRGLEDALFTQLEELGLFVTVFLAHVDVPNNTLEWFNAGHSPVLLFKQDEEPLLLQADTPPLGVTPTRGGVTRKTPFTPGDLMVVCSDGIVDQRTHSGEPFGLQCLIDTVLRCGNASPKDIVDAIFNEVETQTGTQVPDDDRLVVAVRRR